MSELLNKISSIGIVPVIALNNVEDAAPLAKALCKGGLPVAEVTYRTACAHDAMIEMHKACPEMLIGAGTVLTKEQVDSAIDAGAQFIVSPGLNPEIVKYCIEKNIPILPGVSNASDIELALSLGLTTLKFFPAENLGGLPMIQALSAPYRQVKFMPTGGINAKNIQAYLANPSIIACGGTWMIDKQAIAEKNFDKIEELTHQAVSTMLNVKIKHVGLNGDEHASDVASTFAGIFQQGVRETSKSFFGSELAEVMKPGFHQGTHGHIALGVDNVDRAIRYYLALGFTLDESTIQTDEKGTKFVYFNEEVGGFKLHLIRN